MPRPTSYEILADVDSVKHACSNYMSSDTDDTENENKSTEPRVFPSVERLQRAIKRPPQVENDHEVVDEANDLDQVLSIAECSKKRQAKQWLQHVLVPDLVTPKSAFVGHSPALPIDQETVVLRDFLIAETPHLKDEDSLADGAFIEVDLEDFSIYRPHGSFNYIAASKPKDEKPLANQFAPLNEKTGRGEKHWLFDGIVRYGDTRRYVQGIPFDILSIGAYEDTGLHTVGSNIWIQSVQGQKLDIWYRLKSPAREYMRYHETFLWLADLAKHMIDYLKNNHNVSLHHFRSRFYWWLAGVHAADESFQKWYRQYNDTNFCRAIASHSIFLYDQFRDLQLNKKYESHPLWGEIDWVGLDAVPPQTKDRLRKPLIDQAVSSIPASDIKICKTIVTPFVFKCFEHLPWSKFLEPTPFDPAVLRAHHQRQKVLDYNTHFEDLNKYRQRYSSSNKRSVTVGEVISIYSDKATDWKSNDDLWYGYVQGIRDLNRGQAIDLLWLYRPSDTACQKMKYPHLQELFLSDHCNCSDPNIYASEVVSRHKISFSVGVNLDPETEFFIRQKYVLPEAAWVSIKKSDLHCKCKSEKEQQQYKVGDTLLVEINQVLEPVELDEKVPDGRTFRVRRLLRKGRDFGDENAEPNELVYTENFEVIDINDVHRPCQVRLYTKEDKVHNKIPSQYRRRGTADFYYIINQTSQNVNTGPAPFSKPWPPLLKQGWDPLASATQQKMRGLDIFCGGGNLGRGLEEGGAVKFDWAVDYFKEAIHTYRANLRDPNDTKLYYGSVNDYLSQAMEGSQNKLIASVGDVEVISAGSPCQGFSNANQWKWKDGALLNISMVASVVSFVDFYRPNYALLENVTGMAKCSTKGDDSNVFAQVLCALVGMGYQVRPFILDAWNFGSPQGRTRLFISIAAPGLTPLPVPSHSHSHPDNIGNRSLGKTANGLPFGERLLGGLTPFKYVTIEDATKDLPANYNGQVDCIPFPDHRPSRNLTTLNRIRISCIPRFPYGMNYIKAANLGWMPPPQIENFNWDAKRRIDSESRAWKRVIPNALISTITTTCQPEDGLCGAWVHWDACRCMTIMEIRRAQGFPDDEVIIGGPGTQWKIIGNSVARTVALALGMSLRSAWLANADCSMPTPQSNGSLVPTPIQPQSRIVKVRDLLVIPKKQRPHPTTTPTRKQVPPKNSHFSTHLDVLDISDDELIYMDTGKKHLPASLPLCRTSAKNPLPSYATSVPSKRSQIHHLDTNLEPSNLKISRRTTMSLSQTSLSARRETKDIELGVRNRGRDHSDEGQAEESERRAKIPRRWEGRLSGV